MIQSDDFLAALPRHGFGLISGVPCSYLTPLINGTINSNSIRYINAGNEGEAIAIAAGATLGGTGGVAMFQNSGLGNAVSPLTSLTWVFRLPVLVVTTWRGQPGGPSDEPQHELMGQITPDQLRLMDVPWRRFPSEPDQIDEALAEARQSMNETGRPFALVMEKGSVGAYTLKETDSPKREAGVLDRIGSPGSPLTQDEAIRAIQTSASSTDVILATTGFTGRALYACSDQPNQLYMVGSMGCISTLALGLAMAQPNRRVIAVDGDGALLMRLSALAALGLERPPNLLHIVLNNGVHDSTGSQSTMASVVDIPVAALACGYPAATYIQDREAVSQAVTDSRPGMRLLHVITSPRSDRNLPRPRITPAEVARRLQAFMQVDPCPPEIQNG